MNITIPIDVLFFAIPFAVFYVLSLKQSNHRGAFGFTERDCFWFMFFPVTLAVSFALWAIYLKVFQ